MAREVVVSRDCLILVSTTEDGLTSCQMVAYPTMIKVSCVGDGEGIRRVHNGEEAKVLFKKAQGEEPGSPIFILKVATQYRHLKVQQLCDKYENVAALHSRDFNVQRRHQKNNCTAWRLGNFTFWNSILVFKYSFQLLQKVDGLHNCKKRLIAEALVFVPCSAVIHCFWLCRR